METSNNELGSTVCPTLYRVLWTLVSLPSLLLVLGWCWYSWKYRRILSVARKTPVGIFWLPIIGHAHLALLGISGMATRVMRAGKSSIAKGTKTVCLWMGPYPVFFVRSPEDVYTVIASPKTSDKSAEYDFFRFALGNGLLTAPGQIHRITRRHINPMFQPRNLEKLMSVFNESSRHLVRELSLHVGAGHVDIQPLVATIALRNISYVLFGPDINVDTKSEDFKALLRSIHTIATMMLNRFIKIWLWPESVFQFLWKKEIDGVKDSWRKYSQGHLKVLENRTTFQNDSSDDSKTPLTLPGAYRVLRRNYPEFQDQDMHNEMLTLTATGTDTTTTGLSSFLLMLAAHPDIQERVYQEIVSVAGAEDSEVTPEDINNMPYLDMVLKETLRKSSVVPIIARRVKEDIALRDCTIPAGGTIVISLLSLHFDPQHHPDPEKFDPERFSPKNIENIKKYTFLPFSGGSRDCIGRFSAQMLSKTAAIHVLRRFRLSTNVDISTLRYNLALSLASVDGYRLQVEKRKKTT